MNGIQPTVRKKLIQELKNRSEFKSVTALSDTFVDRRISEWADNFRLIVSDPIVIVDMVNLVIDKLYRLSNEEGENALVLFLRVLDLHSLANEVKGNIGEYPQTLIRESENDLGSQPPRLHKKPEDKPSEPFHILRDNRVLKEIKAKIKANTHNFFFLYGPPHVGKTHLLARLVNELEDQYMPLMVQTYVRGSLDDFLFDLAYQIRGKHKKWAENYDIPPLSLFERSNRGDPRDKFLKFWRELKETSNSHRPLMILDDIEYLEKPSEESLQEAILFLQYLIKDPDNGCFIFAGLERILENSKNELLTKLVARAENIPIRYYDEPTVSYLFETEPEFLDCDPENLRQLRILCDGHPRILSALKEVLAVEVEYERILNAVLGKVRAVLKSLSEEYLSKEEFMVTWLVSMHSTLEEGYRFELHKLAEMAESKFSESKIYVIKKGVNKLLKKGWVREDDQNKDQFTFQLGIFPYWLQQPGTIELEEVRNLWDQS